MQNTGQRVIIINNSRKYCYPYMIFNINYILGNIFFISYAEQKPSADILLYKPTYDIIY